MHNIKLNTTNKPLKTDNHFLERNHLNSYGHACDQSSNCPPITSDPRMNLWIAEPNRHSRKTSRALPQSCNVTPLAAMPADRTEERAPHALWPPPSTSCSSAEAVRPWEDKQDYDLAKEFSFQLIYRGPIHFRSTICHGIGAIFLFDLSTSFHCKRSGPIGISISSSGLSRGHRHRQIPISHKYREKSPQEFHPPGWPLLAAVAKSFKHNHRNTFV